MTIGVIGAMQMEVDDLKAQMTDTQTEVYSGVEFVEGKIGDQYVVAAKCGIGCRYDCQYRSGRNFDKGLKCA